MQKVHTYTRLRCIIVQHQVSREEKILLVIVTITSLLILLFHLFSPLARFDRRRGTTETTIMDIRSYALSCNHNRRGKETGGNDV